MGVSVSEQLVAAKGIALRLPIIAGFRSKGVAVQASIQGSCSLALERTPGAGLRVVSHRFGLVADSVSLRESTGKISLNGSLGFGDLKSVSTGRWLMDLEVWADVLYWEIQKRFGFRELMSGRLESPVEKFRGRIRASLVEEDRGDRPNGILIESGSVELHLREEVLGLFDVIEIGLSGARLSLLPRPWALSPCPLVGQVERKRLQLRPLGFGMSAGDPLRSGKSWSVQLSNAKRVWGGCCLDIHNDNYPIDFIPNPNLASSTSVYDIVMAAGGYLVVDAIEVLIVKSILPNGGGKTPSAGTGSDKIVITDAALPGNPFLLAHEIGHVLSGLHPLEAPATMYQWNGFYSSILEESSSLNQANDSWRPVEYCQKIWNPALSPVAPNCCASSFP